jgi:peptide/nickel transport system permease protein
MIVLSLQRFLGLLATLLFVSALVFSIMALLPGDPAAVMLGTSASPDTLAALRQSLGLDQNLLLRYWHWLLRAASGDLGLSYTYGVPVWDLMIERLAVTLPLTIGATLLAITIALPLGVLSARMHNRWPDYLISGFSHLGLAVPGFWVGLLLILLFSTSLGWMPAGGFSGWNAGIWQGIKSLLLPAVALALPQAAVLTRVCRSSMLDVTQEDYMRTAISKGLSNRQAMWLHGLPNALIPVVTMIGLQFTFLMAGAVLVENVFNLPGLGRLAFQALSQRDLIVMQSVVLFFCALVITMNFLVDLAYLALDPRLRSGSSQ